MHIHVELLIGFSSKQINEITIPANNKGRPTTNLTISAIGMSEGKGKGCLKGRKEEYSQRC